MRKELSTIRRGAMIDSLTKEPIRVIEDRDAWPYIRLPLDQLDQSKNSLIIQESAVN